jgi:hypothetical protein
MRSSTEFETGPSLDEKMSRAAEEAGRGLSRRAFIASGVAVGVGAGLGPFGGAVSALADKPSSSKLSKGDAAILRFLAAAEILETDFWQQYNELGGVQDSEVPGGSGSEPYTKALEVLDEDMPQYIHDNTEDEFTHFTFLNAYLESRGAEPVDLKEFATLPSSKATGAQQIGRLTNLMELTVDTTWWTRYRSHTKNPDLGDSFAQAVPGLAKGSFPAIPRSDKDLKPEKHLQAIANTAGFHFATIEQGGTSLYPALAQRTRDAEALRVVLSIGPTEAMHFQTWQDKAGNAPALTDPTNGLEFPNLKESSNEELKANLIMPEPAPFLRKSLPIVSIVRPTNTEGIAMGVVEFLTAMGLFKKQSKDFFDALQQLASEADAARPRG